MTINNAQVNFEILSSQNPFGIKNGMLQITRSFENEYAADLHWHNALEINFMLEGEVEYFTEGKTTRVKTGELLFINSGMIHKVINPIPRSYATAVVMIIPDDYLTRYVTDSSRPYFILKKEREEYTEVAKHMQQIADYLTAEQQPDYINLLIHKEIISILYTLYANCRIEPESRSYHEHTAHDIIDYVAANYMKEMSLDVVADDFGMQKNYFCKWFRQQTGMTFHQYLSRYRLDCALSLFSTSDLTLLDCAIEVGFTTEKTLIDWCKKVYHCTPKQYLNTHES